LSNNVIKAENLGKSYIIGYKAAADKRERYTTLRPPQRIITCKFHNIASKAKQVIGWAATFSLCFGGQVNLGQEMKEFRAKRNSF
jgi:hypothetical protein